MNEILFKAVANQIALSVAGLLKEQEEAFVKGFNNGEGEPFKVTIGATVKALGTPDEAHVKTAVSFVTEKIAVDTTATVNPNQGGLFSGDQN